VPLRDTAVLWRNPLLPAALAAWCGLVSIPVSMLSGTAGAVLRVAALIGAVVTAVATVRWLAQPSRITFDAQVIACWDQNEDGDDGDVRLVPRYFAADDGQQSWSAEARLFPPVQVGDVIRVQAAPRSHRLLGPDPVPSVPASSGLASSGPALAGPVLGRPALGGPVLAGPVLAGPAAPAPGVAPGLALSAAARLLTEAELAAAFGCRCAARRFGAALRSATGGKA
jgi:hypothetical protein